MKILLINPPLISTETIASSIPILLGALEENDINADVFDFNIEFIKRILTREYLLYTKELLLKIYENNYFINENINKKYHLSTEQIDIQKKLIQKYLIFNEDTINKLINIADNLYFDYINVKRKNNIIKTNYFAKLIQIASKFAFLPFYPEEIQLEPFYTKNNPLYKNTYEDLQDKCKNTKRNIYINIFKKIVANINLEKYKVIAISITHTSNFYPALTLSKILKAQSNSKIVLGGIFINSTFESFIKYPQMFGEYFDELLVNCNSDSIVQYVKAIEKNTEPINVNGIIYKKNNIIIKNYGRKFYNDSYFPSYKGINLNQYSSDKVNVEFSKGCYWGKCIFCYSKSNKARYKKDAIKAADKLQYIQEKYGINSFGIVDNALQPEFLNIFSKEIIKRNMKISYSAYMRFEKGLSFNILQNAYISGLKTIFFGLESASPRIIKLINKGINIDISEKILQYCHDIGILTKIGIIYGFPTETEQELKMTINFVKKNREKIYTVSLNPFVLLKNSKLITEKLTKKFNITNIREEAEFSTYLLYNAPGLRYEDIIKIFKECKMKKPEKEIIW